MLSLCMYIGMEYNYFFFLVSICVVYICMRIVYNIIMVINNFLFGVRINYFIC